MKDTSVSQSEPSKCDTCMHEYKRRPLDCMKCGNTGMIAESDVSEKAASYSGRVCDCEWGRMVRIQ